jgi:hypothetical protein
MVAHPVEQGKARTGMSLIPIVRCAGARHSPARGLQLSARMSVFRVVIDGDGEEAGP